MVYEISKAPPWVDFDDLQSALKSTWNWEVDLVRSFQKWNTKNFLVRASTPPLMDSCVVQGHILLVQTAPPLQRKVQVQRQNIKKKDEGHAPKIATPVPEPRQTSETSHPPSKTSGPGVNQEARLDRMEKMMTTLITEMRAKFNETQMQLDEIRLVDYEGEDEDEDEEDDMSEEEVDGGVEQVVRAFTEPPSKKKKIKKHPSNS